MAKIALKGLLAAVLLILFCSQPAFTQPKDALEALEALQKEVEALKEGQRRIAKELEAIKSLLQRERAPQPFKPVVMKIGDDPFKGDRNAKLALIDFTDYQ